MVHQLIHALTRRLEGSRLRCRRRTNRDRMLARRLSTTFETDLELVHVHGIHFYVQDGTVTVYGAVRHDLDRDLLLSLVRQIPGVTGIVGNLQVVDARFQPPQDGPQG